jgi:hypothetical protein
MTAASLRRITTVDWPKSTERNAKAHLIRTARTGHQNIMSDAAAKGLVPSWEAYANSPGNKDLASVKLPGPIVFNYRYLSDVVQVALDELRKMSPVQSGDYVRSHTLFVNGSPVDAVPKNLKAGDQIYIANPIVYARRIEVGMTKSGRPFVLQVEPRIYERVAKRVLIPRYRNQAKITFGYVSLSGSYTVKGGLSSHYGTGKAAGPRGGGTMRKRRQKVGSAVNAPAIFISPLI